LFVLKTKNFILTAFDRNKMKFFVFKTNKLRVFFGLGIDRQKLKAIGF